LPGIEVGKRKNTQQDHNGHQPVFAGSCHLPIAESDLKMTNRAYSSLHQVLPRKAKSYTCRERERC
jgi:hypothetical protein